MSHINNELVYYNLGFIWYNIENSQNLKTIDLFLL
jgi:hypothetical protein